MARNKVWRLPTGFTVEIRSVPLQNTNRNSVLRSKKGKKIRFELNIRLTNLTQPGKMFFGRTSWLNSHGCVTLRDTNMVMQLSNWFTRKNEGRWGKKKKERKKKNWYLDPISFNFLQTSQNFRTGQSVGRMHQGSQNSKWGQTTGAQAPAAWQSSCLISFMVKI